MATNKSKDKQSSDDCRQTTRMIFEAVANALHDRAEKWLSADKNHDVDHPEIRLQRYFGTFCGINDDLKRYNFGSAMSWLETFQKPLAAQVYSQMDLLEKALAPIALVWDPDLDPATLDPLARRLSEVGDFLRKVANTLDANQPVAKAAKTDRGETGGTMQGLRSFIVHGHDEKAKLELKNYLQNALGWPEPVILAEKPSGGKTIIEKFEEHAKNIDVVFVLLTPDDLGGVVGSPLAERARQNVILELGHFIGKFGRTSGRVILLYKGELELPSDLDGIVYIDISNGVESAGEKIRREVATLVRID